MTRAASPRPSSRRCDPRQRRARRLDDHPAGDEELPADGDRGSSARSRRSSSPPGSRDAVKEQILELYLNEIFLGQNSYGVAAAAQTYFNKTLVDLTPHEAAYLAALPQAPSNFHPVRDKDRAISRRNYVLREMYENGYITEASYEMERARPPLETVQGGDIEPFRTALPPRDYFTDEIRRQLSRVRRGGVLHRRLCRARHIDPRPAGGGRARCAGRWRKLRPRPGAGAAPVDPRPAERWATRPPGARRWPSRDPARHRRLAPAVVLEVGESARASASRASPRTRTAISSPPRMSHGRARGCAGPAGAGGGFLLSRGRRGACARHDPRQRRVLHPLDLRQVPEVQGGFMAMDVNTGRVLAMQGGFSYQHSVFNRATQATRQPGSSFKPFVYAAALDRLFPNTIVIDAPIEVDTPEGIWRPTNASNQFYGPTPLRTGIERSRNLMTVRLAQEWAWTPSRAMPNASASMTTCSPSSPTRWAARRPRCYKMVAAYAMFANGGERVEPTLVDRIQDRYGKHRLSPRPALCPDCELASLDRRVGAAHRVEPRAGDRPDHRLPADLDDAGRGAARHGGAPWAPSTCRAVAGKTGTTNDARDVWFVGFTSNIVAGCYIGYDQPAAAWARRLGRRHVRPGLRRVHARGGQEYGGGPFAVPPGGVFYPIDRYSGQRLPPGANTWSTSCSARARSRSRGFWRDRRRLGHGLGPADVRARRGRDLNAAIQPGPPHPARGDDRAHLDGARRGAHGHGLSARSARAGCTVAPAAVPGRIGLAAPLEGLADCLSLCGTASGGQDMRAETQEHIEKIRKSLALLGQRMDLGDRAAPAGGIQRPGRGPDLWNDPERAQKLMRDRQMLVDAIGTYEAIKQGCPTMSS
jgi:penicillin-binding protein 1A